MNIINYISNIAIPFTIVFIVSYAIIEKIKVFDSFLEGAKEGMKIVYSIFPTLLGLFLSINLLRESGVIDALISFLKPILILFRIPAEILPLAMLRPISGSASMAVATDIITSYGADSKIGLIASTIMGSTETTLYTIALYTSSIKVKKTRFILYAGLMADLVGIISSVVFWRFLS